MRWMKRPRQVGARNIPTTSPAVGGARRTDWRSWDPVADEYERIVAPHTAQVAPLLLAAAAIEPGARVLDVGCGTGYTLGTLARSGARAIGCDPSIGMARAGHRARPDQALLAADTINLPFGDGSFDAVTAAFSLHLAPNLQTALFDIRRVLRSGGALGVAMWDAGVDDLTRTWLTLAEQALGVVMFRDARRESEPWSDTLSDKARMETVLRDAGFRPVTITREKIRIQMPLADYIAEKNLQPLGRFTKQMLRDRWDDFQVRVRASYQERFGEHVVDFRDVLIASGGKP